MSSWGAVRTALVTAISSAAGVAAKCVYFADGPQPQGTEPKIRLNIISVSDEQQRIVTTYNPTTHIDVVNEISQINDFTLSVNVQTLANTKSLTALDYVGRIEKGFWFPTVYDALTAAELVYYGSKAIQYVPFTLDDRIVCCYNLDLMMRTQIEFTATSQSYGTIEHTRIGARFVDGPTNIDKTAVEDRP